MSRTPCLQVVWGDPTNPAHYPEGPFDIVYDNNGKDLETCQPLIDHFKVGPAPPHCSCRSCGATWHCKAHGKARWHGALETRA